MMPDDEDFQNDEFDWDSDGFDPPRSDECSPVVCTPPAATERTISLGQRRASRKAYGTGRDAQKTAKLRTHDFSNNPLIRQVNKVFGPLTMSVLKTLVRDMINAFPATIQPRPPSRDQLRVTNGLLQWIDENEELVWIYLRNNGHQEHRISDLNTSI
jgi:hypothetical protein